ncbi:radical SAM 3-amino-3-carboxypropyl radical forming protein [Babesia gibsoni]|uniref:2-(3-amino-3-carboxypropyl)histidine synthase subunit 1 n=1 Tax=Babesia gibsoni TaxID=33632 RepID=A0AAD8PG35_BABGI|nr:radical SAM 3-amino-3-carboxypropyl radical forming protein [Babesia gibsoni]
MEQYALIDKEAQHDGRKNDELDCMAQVVKRALPANYNFEVPKCVRKIKDMQAKTVALQMPEGLLGWGCEIADILTFFCESLEEVIIMADVTYGACCIDDMTASSMGCDLIIHYGHSCLVPVTTVTVQCLYVFVEISFPPQYLAKVIADLFKPEDQIFLMGTIQYSNVLREAATLVDRNGKFKSKVLIPQATPLLPGEVLGCTSPKLHNFSFEPNDMHCEDGANLQHHEEYYCEKGGERIILFIADGRFHLESALIHNPGIKAYRFDPFNKTVSEESYDLETLHSTRRDAIKIAKGARSVCLVVSMLGRQGNFNIMNSLKKMLQKHNIAYHIRFLSEITLDKLEDLGVDAYIQVGCPRLSIDWGTGFGKPILNPYEAYVTFSSEDYRNVYPMDYYANDGGEWSNYTANRREIPRLDNKDAIRLRLQQRATQKQIKYTS